MKNAASYFILLLVLCAGAKVQAQEDPPPPPILKPASAPAASAQPKTPGTPANEESDVDEDSIIRTATPQITDAGTVVLHVIAENNSVNTAIAVNGTPGIDTQRMETEVLVPDGGTTVVGGVLGSNESETQNRTPGVASIPILGNLFKRKLVTRQSTEILFFITPRIYRPDFMGRPTSGTVSSGTRTTTIAQPVPMGNPPTNTPNPTQQSQQPTTPSTLQVPNLAPTRP